MVDEATSKEKTSPKALVWIERLVWIFIYGGLVTFVLGLAILQPFGLGAQGDGMSDAEVLAYVLLGKGAIAVAAGVVMIGLRSRWK